ncbi:Taf4p NDAI_0D00930 [Naumovozyma dairenensis CBS 421]|uniref:Transcription initiation factor TFIID subunit 4 n=1 Tax=Naumovozyma dairenensis (strain ATCC 10597 / BCRC 20456 / CBS 421 / NBRC 0211 / NRRL Y-12639) TaxID=1071378 RepID=G0W9E6_NAUDC|nr:hypothetical protein NDAI_0D00930 [Naumovozyma dairenensis CBS 421]CCD24407.1 hypothetical protein NDAI_0D00930 [Naumovozyma dairenensis CBS 421]
MASPTTNKPSTVTPTNPKTNPTVILALPKRDDSNKQNSSTKSKSKGTVNSGNGGTQQQSDPNKMQDVLFSAGVDIREEEALLHSSINQSKSKTPLDIKIPPHPPFLHPEQVNKFMQRVMLEQQHHQILINQQNYKQNPKQKTPEILQMISDACEDYMKDIITNTLVISRHRRKAIKVNTGRRSEISMILRTMAINEKKEEEKRVKKRIALGLEKEDLENKLDSEETLHRASNVTAGLRAGSKKQYGWLTSSVNKPTNTTVKSAGKVAAEIAARGELGLKFREAREEPGIVMRDLLFALENRRIGVHNVISKGYARIRD